MSATDMDILYCRYRLAGMTARDAAQLAGYSSSPSPKATALWHRVEELQRDPGGWKAPAIAAELVRAEAKLVTLTTTIDSLRLWLRALEMLSGT